MVILHMDLYPSPPRPPPTLPPPPPLTPPPPRARFIHLD